MAMSPPTPSTCSSTRIATSTTGKYTAPAAVLSAEPCLFSPIVANTQDTFMGPAEVNKWLLFVTYDADVQLGDEITDDDTAEVFIVVEPPQKFKRPSDWSNDHQQIQLMRKPVQ